MAEQQGGGGDKTEKPSQQKLRKAREQGQVARSKDLATAIGLLAAVKVAIFMMPGYLQDFRLIFAQSFIDLGEPGSLDAAAHGLVPSVMWLLLKMLLPLLAIPAAVLIASSVPGGFTFNGGNLLPKFGRLSPMGNLGRLASGKHWADFAVSVGKACVLGVLLYHLALGSVDAVHLQGLPLGEALLGGSQLLIDAVMAMCGVFVLFALIDVPIQRFLFLQGQRMTKQEVKEE